MKSVATTGLVCVECAARYPANEDRLECARCGGGLAIELDLGGLDVADLRRRWADRPIGTWRYRELLPEALGEPVTMNEGGTALLPAPRVAKRAGLGKVWIKVEGENPTGSFKDRGMTVGVTRARSLGHRRVVCASTGNTAASMAAYAARAGLEAIVIVPSGGVARGKLAQAVAHGARIVALRGSFDDAMRIVREGAPRLGAHVLNSINPYRIEGQKTAAFEVWEQLGGAFPDWLVCPSGNGGNLAAYWKGFSELLRAEAKGPPPRLASVQAEGASPIARAILEGGDLQPVATPETVASAIRIGNPANGRRTVRAVRESGGTAAIVSDREIEEAQRFLASREGLFVEPSSAASVAGLWKLAAQGTFDREARIVCVATGHGLKDPEAAAARFEPPSETEPTFDAVFATLDRPRPA